MAKDTRAVELIGFGDKLFTEKKPLDSLNQEIAENVYPERADWTRERYLGENWADHLMDSFPTLARRELGNSLSAILRPRDRAWFRTTTLDEERDNDPAAAKFLEFLTKSIRSAIYHPKANFVASTKKGDHDFVTFGNAVISVEESPDRDHLFFRTHHPRDCVWMENELELIDTIHRKDRMTARQMVRKFGEKNVHAQVLRAADKEPNALINLRCVVMPADDWEMRALGGSGLKANAKSKLPYVIVYVDADNAHICREGGLHDFTYVIPRWQRITGYQYGFSPPSLTTIPDSRTAQMLASIILESGEKMIEPPLAALEAAVKEASLESGSITWVDAEYEGKVKDAIMPLALEGDMRIGFEMRKDIREILTRGWFLDKLALPESGKQMTAYETAQRLEEHVRNLLPIIEPVESEYNTQLLDKTFSILMNMRALDFRAIPDVLSGADISWAFMNPMQEASTRILVSQATETAQVVAQGMQQGVKVNPIKPDVMLADAVRGIGGPASWRKTQAEMEAEAQQMEEAQAQQAQLAKLAQAGQMVGGAADVAGKVGDAAKSLRDGGVLPQQAAQSQIAGKKRQLQLPPPQPMQPGA